MGHEQNVKIKKIYKYGGVCIIAKCAASCCWLMASQGWRSSKSIPQYGTTTISCTSVVGIKVVLGLICWKHLFVYTTRICGNRFWLISHGHIMQLAAILFYFKCATMCRHKSSPHRNNVLVTTAKPKKEKKNKRTELSSLKLDA